MFTRLSSTDQRQISAVQTFITQLLAQNVLAIHLYGSAIDGGLQHYSDIDLLVTVHQPLSQDQRHALMQGLLKQSAFPATSATLRALEVTVVVHDQVHPWRFPPMRDVQFGEWLRDDILAHTYEPPQSDPDLAILLAKARQASHPLMGPEAKTLFDPIPKKDLLHTFQHTLNQWQSPDDLRGDERNIILAIARIWYSAHTQKITTKDQAAAWLIPQLPVEHAQLLATACAEYLGRVNHDWHSALPQVIDFVAYAQTHINLLFAASWNND